MNFAPGMVSAMILACEVIWDRHEELIFSVCKDEDSSLYDSLEPNAQKVIDLVIAIHKNDKTKIKDLLELQEIALSFISGTLGRRWSYRSLTYKEEKERAVDIRRLQRLKNRVLQASQQSNHKNQMSKPQSKGEARHKALSPCRAKKAYYPGSKPFMKKKMAKARRRVDQKVIASHGPYRYTLP